MEHHGMWTLVASPCEFLGGLQLSLAPTIELPSPGFSLVSLSN